MTTDEAKAIFGVDPTTVGIRHRGWSVIDAPDDDDMAMGAEPGWLWVKARDGAENERDDDVDDLPGFMGDTENSYDQTYRLYYFRPLTATEKAEAVSHG